MKKNKKNKDAAVEITANTNISFLLSEKPAIKQLFKEKGIECATCKGNTQDAVRHLVNNYGFNLDDFIAELNKVK